jgi:glyoxylase-like metal-dependent hydrolase (beta-lactamase superfamily II)
MASSRFKIEALLTGNWRGATSVLVSEGRHHIVIDSGMPHEAHLLLNALGRRGLKPEDIRTVVNTHFHVDHVLNNSLFPNSLIYASQQSYDWSCSLYSDLRDEADWEKLVLKYYPEMHEHQQAAGMMGQLRKLALRWWDRKRLGDPSNFRWLETTPLPNGLDVVFTSGHVPGHASIVVGDGGERTIIAGDTLLSREDDARILTMIPHNRTQSILDRDRLVALGGRVLPGHGEEFFATDIAPKQTSGAPGLPTRLPKNP